jgi:hypothetical protein
MARRERRPDSDGPVLVNCFLANYIISPMLCAARKGAKADLHFRFTACSWQMIG